MREGARGPAPWGANLKGSPGKKAIFKLNVLYDYLILLTFFSTINIDLFSYFSICFP